MTQPLNSSVELQLQKWLSAVAEYKASDFHLSVGNAPTLRVGGELVQLPSEELLTPEFIASVAESLMDDTVKQELDLLRSVNFVHSFKGRARYKVHIYYQSGYISITFRLLQNVIIPLNQLEVSDQVKNVANITDGLIIVTGDYGVGKSTVLASYIDYINQSQAKHIVTFEQPVELLITDAKSIVEQREFGTDVPGSAAIIPFISQEDVDVVLISNVNDGATLQAAIDVAQMGKLVFIEMAAHSVRSALERMISMVDPANEQQLRNELISVMRAVVALYPIANTAGSTSLASEVLLMSPGVVSMIKQGSFDKVDLVIENGQNEGMLTYKSSLNMLVQSGKVTQHQM